MTILEALSCIDEFKQELSDPSVTVDRRDEIEKELRRISLFIRAVDLQINTLRAQKAAQDLGVSP